METPQEEEFMRRALALAREAAEAGEVPVGCVLVVDGKIVGEGRNRLESLQDPSAHAEMEAMRDASGRMGSWRIGGTLYTTLEPCPMCAGAALQARVERVVFGAPSPWAASREIWASGVFNHTAEVTGGLLEEECAGLLRDFFRELRQTNEAERCPSG